MQTITVKRFSLWGTVALGLVLWGTLLSRGVIAQAKPLYVSGADVPSAIKAGRPDDTVRRMKLAYEALKNNNWDVNRLPFELLTTPDQKYSENEEQRNQRTSAFCVPKDKVYSEVALWCETYFRRNVSVYTHRSVAKPEGYFLVMYKNGRMVQVPGSEVRMVPHPTIPDASMPVFPGMSAYRRDLPTMSCFQTG